MATRTTKKTTTPTPTKKNPTTVTYNSKGEKYVTNTNSAGTKTGVSVTNAGIKTVKVVNSKGVESIRVYDSSGNEIKATNNAKPVPAKNTKATVVAPAKITKPAAASTSRLTSAQMDSIPFKNNTIKNYEIYNRALLDRSGALYGGSGLYGTEAQRDSSQASISKYNIARPGVFKITKSSFFPGDERLAEGALKSRIEYVPPKDTKSGPLLKKPQTKESIESLQKRNR